MQFVGIERMKNVKKSNVGIVVIDLNMQDMILLFVLLYIYIYYWNRKNIVRLDYYNKYIIKKSSILYILYLILNIYIYDKINITKYLKNIPDNLPIQQT